MMISPELGRMPSVGPLLDAVEEVFTDRSAGASDAFGFEVEVVTTDVVRPLEGWRPSEEPWRVVRLGLSRRAIDDQIETLLDLASPSLMPPLLLLPEGEQLPLAVQPLAGLLPSPRTPFGASSLSEELFLALVV
jgi:hypothetical protein